jgi:hypothetical protein
MTFIFWSPTSYRHGFSAFPSKTLAFKGAKILFTQVKVEVALNFTQSKLNLNGSKKFCLGLKWISFFSSKKIEMKSAKWQPKKHRNTEFTIE